MAKDSQQLEQEFIATAKDKTGHALDDWMGIIRKTGMDKPNAILKWLKEEHKLNHAQANFLSGIYLNDGKPVYDYAVLFAKLFADKEPLLPIYRELEKNVQAVSPDIVLIPTKSYISIEAKRIFACATPMRSLLRVGLDLGETPFDAYVQKAKSLGAMPNLTHMVELNDAGSVNQRLLGYMRQAYERTHSKI